MPAKNQGNCVKCRVWLSSSRIGPEHLCGQREGASGEWWHALGVSLFPVVLLVCWLGWAFIAAWLFLVTGSGGCSLAGAPRCRAKTLGHTGFRSWGPGLWSPGSIAEALGLSCCMACGIFPEQGSNPAPARAGGFPTTEPAGEPRDSQQTPAECFFPHSADSDWGLPYAEPLGFNSRTARRVSAVVELTPLCLSGGALGTFEGVSDHSSTSHDPCMVGF